MKISVFLYFLLVFFGAKATEIPVQDIEAAGVREFKISELCRKVDTACGGQAKKELEKYQLPCQMQTQNNECEELGKAHTDWQPLFRRCDIKSICQQNEEFLQQQRSACLRGFKNAAIELGKDAKDLSNSLGDFVESKWDDFKKNSWDKENFLKECDKSMACKRDLVKNDPGYKNLSDEKLSQLPAAFLQKRAKKVEETLEQTKRERAFRSFIKNDEQGLSLNPEQLEKLNRLKALILGEVGDLEEKYKKFVCYSPLAQEEMRCYVLGGGVDLFSVGYYSVRTAARAFIAIKRLHKSHLDEVFEKAEAPLSGETTAVATAERRKDAPAKVDEEKRLETSSRTPAKDVTVKEVNFKTIPHLPSSVRLTEVTNIEGKKQLKYERAVQLNSGEWVKVTKEFQMDKLTGAIDANFPAGRDLFESIMHEKAGKAHFAFFDVGSLGAVNKTFAAGREAGDRYIKSVADIIMKHGEGKVTLARLGGDEFGLIIDEIDPQKVQKLLSAIQKDLRQDVTSDAHKVFREEKIARKQEYKANKTEETRNAIDGEKGIARIRQDISIGGSQIGAHDNLHDLLVTSEEQAKQMKIDTTLAFGRSAEKYGSKATPQLRPRPKFVASVQKPADSASWNEARTRPVAPHKLEDLREAKKTFNKELKRFKNESLVSYVDETGHTSYFLERYVTDPKTGQRVFVHYEIPTRGQTGMLDGKHPASQEIIMDYFSTNPGNILVMPKAESLRYVNYFEDGTKSGDELLSAASKVMQKHMRNSDLKFKLDGADFLWSVDNMSEKELKTLVSRVNKEFVNSPELKNIMQRQKKSLEVKLAAAQRAQDSKEITALKNKLNELQNMNTDLKFEFIKRSDIAQDANFDDVMKKLDDKFEQSREAQH
ncbi:MAG: diguanylate cyclase domain-containing protein [Pseudobdellovibrionaceae bacterium]